jgi:hypothetical protein
VPPVDKFRQYRLHAQGWKVIDVIAKTGEKPHQLRLADQVSILPSCSPRPASS